MRSRFLILLLVLATLILGAAPSAAEVAPPDSDAYIDEEDTPTVEVNDSDDPDPTDDSSEDDGCVWEVVIDDDFVFEVYGDDGGPSQHSATGRWLQKVCADGPVLINGAFLVPEGGLVDPEALAEEAMATIGIEAPVIRTSPDLGDRLYVRVPTWLWLDESWWHGYQATATAGRVTATVSALPVASTWSMGDGSSIDCTGPGVAWHAGLAEDATDCSHTYTTSSAGRDASTFSLSATVQLEVTWTSNIGAGGTLPTVSRTSTRPVEVAEIQAIGTR